MKTVLHIITGLSDGGAEAVLYRLCTYSRRDYHHVVSLSGAGKYGPLLMDAGIPVTCLNMPRGRITVTGLLAMWRTIRRVRPDVVQTWMYHANLLGGIVAWLAGVRNIIWGIHHSTLCPGGVSRSTMLVTRAGARLSRWIPRRIVCCAEQASRAHAAVGYDPGRILVIPNGYDLSVFRPDPAARTELRNSWELGTSEPVIGCVARFHPLKDHANLFQALAILRTSISLPICLLVGTDMTQSNAELTRMIAEFELTDRVRLLGPRNDIPAVMNTLDLHVMSSAGEGFPNVLAEAMACGTPCVSTEVGDAAAILGVTGKIVPPRDPVALAAAIAEMLAEHARPAWAGHREAARKHVSDNFSIAHMLDSYHRTWFENDVSAHQ